mgnify:FL=1
MHLAFLVYNAVEMIKTRNHYNDGLRVFLSTFNKVYPHGQSVSPFSRTAKQSLKL